MLQSKMTITVLTAAAAISVGLSGCQVYQKCRMAMRPKRCSQCEQNAVPHGYSDPGHGLHPIPENGESAPPIPGNVPRIPPAPGASSETGLRRIPLPQDHPVVEHRKPSFMQRVKFGLSKLNPLKSSRRDPEPQMQPTLAPANEGLRPSPDRELPNLHFPQPAEPQRELRGPSLSDPHTTSFQQFESARPAVAANNNPNGIEDWPYAPKTGGSTITATSRHHYSEPELLRDFQPALTATDRPAAPTPTQSIPVVSRKREPQRVPAMPVAQPRPLSVSEEPKRQMPEQFPQQLSESGYAGPRFTPVEVPAETTVPNSYRNYRAETPMPAPSTTPRFADVPVRNFN